MGKAVGRRALRLAVIVAVVLAAAGGIAYATIPDGGKVFTACMLKQVGTIRLVDTSLPASNPLSHCTVLETQVSWNQLGQPGTPGAAGANGKDGAQGTPGQDGTNGTNGTDGKDGVPGLPGADGKDGANGADGVSVTSAVEPAGANCANGGSKFTSASGVTFACNGASGTGGGPTGQSATTAYGSGALTTTGFTFANVPGLTSTTVVPANSVLFISTDGGIAPALVAGTAATSVVVDVEVTIDGTTRAFHRIDVFDNAAVWSEPIGYWSMAFTTPLAAGSHTITVSARLAGSFGTSGGAIVSGDNSSILQGTLNVVTIAQ